MLEALSEDLITCVLKEAPLSLDRQLHLLPPHMHALAVHSVHPELAAHSSLTLDCTSVPPSTTIAAFSALAAIPIACKLSLSSIFPVRVRYEGINRPSEVARTSAIAQACSTCNEVSLDIETRLQKVAGLWTELLHALQQNDALHSLKVLLLSTGFVTSVCPNSSGFFALFCQTDRENDVLK